MKQHCLLNSFSKKDGFAITNVMIAAAIMGIVAMAMTRIMQQQTQHLSEIQYRSELISFIDDVRSHLSDPEACLATFKGADLSSNKKNEIKDIKNSDSSTRWASSGVYNHNSLLLQGMSLEFAGTTNKGVAQFTLNTTTPKSILGPKDRLRKIDLNIQRSGSTLVSCSVKGGGSGLAANQGQPHSLGHFVCGSGRTFQNDQAYPILVNVYGGQGNLGGQSSNRCALNAQVQGVPIATTYNNNETWAKGCFISFMVPAQTEYRIASLPYNAGQGSCHVVEFR